ncbi:MAG: sigma 54-dependent Fis family transcriptional regulator [Sandaracinaceae bacterium]|nr:sigma 54-dependent Fis family transcriptional regulator [Sandaracinaceae bacterium]
MNEPLELVCEGRRVQAQHGVIAGRDPSCALVLRAERVSRQHFVIEVVDDVVYVRDLFSRNGTRVNGAPIERAALRAGDRIDAGDAVVDVRAANAETPAPPAADGSGALRVRLRAGEERYSVDPARWADTEHPDRVLHVPPLLARFEALYRGSLLGAQAEDVPALCEAFAALARELFGARGASIVLAGPRGLAVVASSGERREDAVTLASEALAEAASAARTAGSGVALVALVKTRERRLGALVVHVDALARDRAADELELLVALAHQAAVSLEALRRREGLALENEAMRAHLGESATELVGTSPVMVALREAIARYAAVDSVVLVSGESGTGKELVARALHAASARAGEPLVSVNCGGLTDALLTSELFGHERGAFTNADRRHVGLFERAHGGTLFFDEIGELSLEAQVRLLRVLESMRVMRVGGTEEVAVDVRVIAATHRDLSAMVREGRFRQDLYYRLDVLRLEVPPLRARTEDVPALAAALLAPIVARMGRSIPTFTPAALARLCAYGWPGNVRELRNVLERACILGSSTIDAGELRGLEPAEGVSASDAADPGGTLLELERRHIQRVLDTVRWNKTRAAEVLGITRQTVHEKIRQHGLRAPE